MGFNRRQMEDRRRQAAEKVAVERRAVKLGLLRERESFPCDARHTEGL
jgi:hypothetical protein